MPARMKHLLDYEGSKIFLSANTHPGAKTKSVVVLTNGNIYKRFPFSLSQPGAKGIAMAKAQSYIDYLTAKSKV